MGNLFINPGFKTGSVTTWNCDPNDTIVTTAVHKGTYALEVTPTTATTGECGQIIAVQPHHTYTLSAYVNGPYASLGVQNDASTWTSCTGYTLLSVTITTGLSQTSITISIHGWYSAGDVLANNFFAELNYAPSEDGPGVLRARTVFALKIAAESRAACAEL